MKWIGFLIVLLAARLPSAHAAEKEAMGSGKSMVYSCTVVFANDSDTFSPDRIKACIKDIDPQLVTYVHVVATATTTGTSEHNLDLSNRRAQAVGNFITRSFPNVRDIHLFGGGKNPRLGRQARVFIIVQPEVLANEPEPMEPQVIHEVEIRHEVKTVTVPVARGQRGFEAVAQYGVADVEHYEFKHRYLSFGLRRDFVWTAYPSLSLNLGAHFSQYQSTLLRDFEALHAEGGLKKIWDLSGREFKIFSQASGLFGVTTNHEKSSIDFGAKLEGGWERDGLRVGLVYAHAYQLKQLGLMVGIDF